MVVHFVGMHCGTKNFFVCMRGQYVECVVQANEMRLLLTMVLADVAMGVV